MLWKSTSQQQPHSINDRSKFLKVSQKNPVLKVSQWVLKILWKSISNKPTLLDNSQSERVCASCLFWRLLVDSSLPPVSTETGWKYISAFMLLLLYTCQSLYALFLKTSPKHWLYSGKLHLTSTSLPCRKKRKSILFVSNIKFNLLLVHKFTDLSQLLNLFS